MTSDRSVLERQMADVELRPFTIDEFHRRRHHKQRNRRIGTTVLALVLVVAAIGGILRALDSDDTRITTDNVARPDIQPPSPFVGSWVSTDTDGSTQTMDIQPSGTVQYEMVIHDDAATAACLGVPATLTGTGRLKTSQAHQVPSLAIAAELTCDDGSTPVPFRDPATAADTRDLLANFTFVHDPATDELTDSLEVVWRRPGAAPTTGDLRPRS